MRYAGSVEEIVFRNEQNNYSVIGIDCDGELYTAVGNMPELNVGQMVEIEGELVNNSRFGEQIQVRELHLIKPNTLSAIQKYLGSGLIRGVGPITAEKIVKEFGMDTLDIMEMDPMRLATIRGISRAKAEEIAGAYSELRNMQDSIMFLQSHNISTNMAIKIYDIYKTQTIPTVQSNPYKLVEDINGIGFSTADKIAVSLNIDHKSEFRIRAGLMHTMKEATDRDGHTYLPLNLLIDNARKLLDLDEMDNQEIEKVVNLLCVENVLKILTHHNEPIVMMLKYYFIEKFIANKLTILGRNCYSNEMQASDLFASYEKIHKVKLGEEQKQAVMSAITNGVSVITGGPGTGKTTIVRCLLDFISQEHKQILLLAPTGRAAKRLSETTGLEAKTIHRALEMVPAEERSIFNRNENNPLNADFIVIDEMSMVDVNLFYFLLKATRPSAQLVLVGDKDQLPSVNAGNVLKDIIESDKIHTTYLNKIYRQDERSLIVSNAHLINDGKMPVIDNTSADFFFEQEPVPADCADKIVNMVCSRLPAYCKTEATKIQVLAPMKVGPCGIDSLNRRLQDRINPHRMGMQLFTEHCAFRVGDKVMQTVNNYELGWSRFDEYGGEEKGQGVFNGDIGYITHIAPSTFETTVNFDDGRVAIYTRSDISELTLAYAITIHKSQGSEFDYVVIPVIAGAPIILTKNLIYTAITRAKKMVVLVGTRQNLARMIHNTYTAKRYTMLRYFLSEELKFE